MKLIIQLIILSGAYLIVSCATTYSRNPWETPDRYIHIPSSERAQFNASMSPCIEYARKTFNDALYRFQNGLPEGSAFYAIVFNDPKGTSYIKIDSSDSRFIRGHVQAGNSIKGKSYAAGDYIILAHSDLIDWYIIHRDRPSEGNLIGKYLLLKQDGLAPGACDPHDIEFQRFRYFSMGYSFVPPVAEGWEMKGPAPGAEMGMQQKDENLDEVNTLTSAIYQIEPNKSDQELVELARSVGRYGNEEGVRYNVVKLEAELYLHRQARCARSFHIVEDKKALLSKLGKRGFMIRDVQALVCVHPADDGVAVVLRYSHRHHPGKRDSKFINKANKVFESLAFTTQYN